MNCIINTNISEIPKAKSLFFDTSHYNNYDYSMKFRPITSRINIKNQKLINYMPKSPSISNYGFTPKYLPKLFSLLDINEKNISKAPNLPNQYKRKIYNNIYNLLYNKNKKGLIFKIPQIESNKTKIIPDEIKKIKKNKSEEQIDKLLLTMSRKERLYTPKCWDNASFEDIKKNQRDKLMPEGYEFYEKQFLDNNQNYIKNNYVKLNKENIKDNKKSTTSEKDRIKTAKDSILIRKLNKLNQYKSNIFFIDKDDNNKKKEKNKKLIEENKKILYSKYFDSDIFNLSKKPNIIMKSGEHSFFEENKKRINKYNSNNETLLGWKLRKPLPSFLNYTSSQFNLFNRDMKNIGKTKENILNEVKKIDEKYNPTHKQKGLTEYIELSRVSAPNINEDYNKAIKDDPNIFKKKNNISSEYFDLHNHYNNLCDKPFKKFNIIN